MVVSCAFLTFGDAITKLLTDGYPVGQIMFVRSMITLTFMCMYVCLTNELRSAFPRRYADHVPRALLFAGSSTVFVISLSLLPLPVVTSIMFTSPIIAVAVAAPLLGEHVGPRRWLAVVLGFIGVLIVVAPGGENWQAFMLIPLLGAILSAFRDLLTRRLTTTETSMSILFMAMLLTSLLSLATLPFGWVRISQGDIWLFAVAGFSQGLAFYLQISSLRHGAASIVVPFRYSIVFWSVLFGYLFWSYVPTLNIIVGIGVMTTAGILMFIPFRFRGRP